MEDAPPPDANDLRTRCSEIASAPPIWRVEKMDEDGGYEVTVFSGGDARTRAIRYADREYGDFDEIELEPYPGAARP